MTTAQRRAAVARRAAAKQAKRVRKAREAEEARQVEDTEYANNGATVAEGALDEPAPEENAAGEAGKASGEPTEVGEGSHAGRAAEPGEDSEAAETTASRVSDGPAGGTARRIPGGGARRRRSDASGARAAAPRTRAGGGADKRTDTPSRIRAAWLTVIILCLIVSTITTSGVILVTRLLSLPRYDAGAAKEALRVAPGYVEQVISYDYRTLERDVPEAKKNLTGDFHGQYERSMAKVAPTLVSNQAIQEAKATKAGVQDASAGEVSVLVFTQRLFTKADSEDPKVYQDRILVTLTKVDDRWLISQMRYLV
jgi:Mce-associated membrane protein